MGILDFLGFLYPGILLLGVLLDAHPIDVLF